MRRDREHEEQHEHEQRRGSEHAERGQVAVAAAREAAAAALDAHRLFTGREVHIHPFSLLRWFEEVSMSPLTRSRSRPPRASLTSACCPAW